MNPRNRTISTIAPTLAFALALGIGSSPASAQSNAYRDPLLSGLDASIGGKAVTDAVSPQWQSTHNAALGAARAGRPREAEALYFRALELSTNPLHRAMTLTNLGDLYAARRRTALASKAYNEAIQMWEQAVGAAHPALALSLNNLAALQLAQRRPAEAQRDYRRALGILVREFGPDSVAVAAVLSNLGCACRMGGQKDEAEKSFQQALAMREKRNPKDVGIAVVVNNLAQLRAEQGKAAEAQPLFERALSIWEKQLGPNHSMVAIGLQTYGDFQRGRGKSDLAAPLYERALAILEARRGLGDFEILPTVLALGETYTALGRYAEADQQFVRAVQMSKDVYGPNHPDVAATLEQYAVLQQKSGRPARAAQTLQEARRIRDLQGPTAAGNAIQAGRF